MHRSGEFGDGTPLPDGPSEDGLTLTPPSKKIFCDHRRISNSSSPQGCQQLRDFATRISFDILNEAMVMATEEVLSSLAHGGCNSHVVTTAPTPNLFQETNADPAETSSEGEEEQISLDSDKPLVSHHHHLELSDTSSTSLDFQSTSNSSNSSKLPNRQTPSFSPGGIPPYTKYKRNLRSKHRQSLLVSSIRGDSSSTSSNAMRNVLKEHSNQELRVNGPLQCDVYNLPVDNVDQPPENEEESRSQYSRRSRPVGTTTNRPNRYSRNGINSDSDNESTELESRRNSQKCSTNFGEAKCDGNVSFCVMEVDSSEERENQPSPSPSASGRTWKQSRRSRSVEAKISSLTCFTTEDEDDEEPVRVPLGDRHLVNEVTTAAAAKSEKRTIGHSILNLFKRKSRTKTQTVEEQIPHNPSLDFASRALPPPPENAEFINEVEPTIRVSYPREEDETEENPFPAEDAEIESSDEESSSNSVSEAKDFAVSIERVKDCGWYFGPLGKDAAEDLLRGEPDGSFIVRDSSDVHYIFSLTFKLNGLVRHVRIEHDQGNFSFGPLTRFKASTIVDFVEKAVAHSRSGRYLFFLHRRPVLGPMRVQLLYPYSRFRHPRSLQHMCRFVILKHVRRDLIPLLPLPPRLQDYLNTQHYYYELPNEKGSA